MNAPRGAPTSARAAPPPGERVDGDGSAASPYRLCHANGGPSRTDYPFVASYRCADGSRPLGGDAELGARARLGNVGAGPDGHIVDLYEIPCRSGAVRIHVDGYHCPDVDTTIDMSRLTAPQLANLARSIRELHRDVDSVRAFEMRRSLLIWTLQTQQLTVVVCDAVFGLVPGSGSSRPYLGELTLSYAAAVIEDGRPVADPATVTERALAGVLLYYEASRAQDPSIQEPQLDQLLATARSGGLPALARRTSAACGGWDRLGVHF